MTLPAIGRAGTKLGQTLHILIWGFEVPAAHGGLPTKPEPAQGANGLSLKAYF